MPLQTKSKKPAVFFDRDGVINPVKVINSKAYAPRKLKDLSLYQHIPPLLKKIKKMGYLLIIISNQPDIALKNINEKTKRELEKKFINLLKLNNIQADLVLYCNHHEKSINPKYPKTCPCRKPKSGMILEATKLLNINLKNSYIVGDTWRDIKAGNAAKIKTILLNKHWSEAAKCSPDYKVSSLKQILDIMPKYS